jgi:kanamycin kinase
VAVPDAVAAAAGGRTVQLVWDNPTGGLTYAVGEGAARWADIAVATWSAEWNYGPGWEPLLLDAYGVQPDPERTRYYRLLWDLSS